MISPPFHILVVDDLVTVRYTIITLLKKLGHITISEAKDGEQALKILQSSNVLDTPIDFVVTDWNMPVMNGLALLKAIRANADLLHLPVLMITGEAENENFVAATQAGVDGYIVKPSLNAKILEETLNKIILRRKLVV